jgi:hypothetical protein
VRAAICCGANVADWRPEELWRTYIQLTEAEAAFRIQKSDSPLRPVWHQKSERVKAHILVCFLSYAVWQTLGQSCSRAGRKVFDEIAVMDVVLPTRKGATIRKRCVAQPTPHQQFLLQRLGLRLPVSLAVSNFVVKTFGMLRCKENYLSTQLRKLGWRPRSRR